jgi:predicted alpha/beta-fold hydrolase
LIIADASCHTRVSKIDVPLLAISAVDDPCVDSLGMPRGSGSEFCTFVLTQRGGHLGFLQSGLRVREERYSDLLACQWIGALIKQ